MSSRRPGPKATATSAALTGVTAAVVACFLVPILWLITSSFRPASKTFETAYPPGLDTLFTWPLDVSNYEAMVAGGFLRTVVNSLVVSVATVALGLILCALAAYAFAAIEFAGRTVLFAAIIVGFLLPFEALAIPLATQFRDWGLDNSYAGLILPGLGNGLSVFILRQFFLGVPRELKEAAALDGASEMRTFWMIYLPLAKPALIGAGLILFLFQWQAYLWPLLITSEPSMDVAPVALARNFGLDLADYGQLFPQVVVLSIIPIVVLLALQKYFVSSLATTGSKD